LASLKMHKCIVCTNTVQDASKFYCPSCCGDTNPTVTMADLVQIVGREYTEKMTQEEKAAFRRMAREQRTVFMNSLLERVLAAHPGHRINFDIGAINFNFSD
jgi:hypothetical protein